MKHWLSWLLVGCILSVGPRTSLAQDAGPNPTPAEVRPVVEKAVAYLRATQSPDGSFSRDRTGPGLTALIVAALLRHGYSADDPLLAKAIKYLETSVKPDGGVYEKMIPNYTTCCAILAFREANRDGRYDRLLKNAAVFLRSVQADETRGVTPNQPAYGGVGYDAKSRPDLSNTQFFVEALQAAGVPSEDPAMKRAVQFISRCQNLPGEFNDQPFAQKAGPLDKGGFVYSPQGGGQSAGGKTPEGGLRSVGVMTYAGLKSFLYAGLKKDDPRVQAAIDWLRRHYTVAENPGQGKTGLYYYYHVFAKAMTTRGAGADLFEDAKGQKHNWRRDLFTALQTAQQANGSWANANDRFMEGDPNICTAFALLALSYCGK